MERMRWFALTGLLIFFSIAYLTHAGEPPQTVAEEIIVLEKEGWEDLKNHDLAAYGKLIAEDFVAIDESGIVGKAASLKEVTNLSIADYTMEDAKVTMLSPDVALLAYKATLKGTYEGQDLGSKPYYYGSVYARRGGRWLAVFTQETRSQ